MLDKVRIPHGRKQLSVKTVVAYCLFGMIILVFVFFGMSKGGGPGMENAGVAALVNHSPISIAEYRTRLENVEQNAKARFDQVPEAQRKMLMESLKRRTLEDLIAGEVLFQEGKAKGILASDGEVRDYILQIPFLQDNGHFQKDRYTMFLKQMNMNPADFERQVRKQIVVERLQELFVGSATPTQEEMKRTRMLSTQKINLKFVEFNRGDLAKPGFVSDADVTAYSTEHTADIEKYYKDNVVEYSKPERVKARHILIRIDDKRPEATAKKLADEIKAKATPATFAKLATENSDDPGSKAKGGDLGEFDRGRMVPEFENAAFATAEGKISEPIKTAFGYHIIYVEKKMAAEVEPLDKVKGEIARKLVTRNKETEILDHVRKVVEKGDRKEVDALVAKSGLKWSETGEFDLSTSMIPKLGESQELVSAVLKHGRNSGLVPKLVESEGRYLVAELLTWKESAATPEVEGADRMAAYRKSSDLLEAWRKDAQAHANIERNPMISGPAQAATDDM